MRYRDILTETWQRQWRKTQTLPIGHKLYHGTNAVFEPEDDELMAPAWFSSSPSVAKHFARGGRVLAYRVIAPIRLPVITSRKERQQFFEKFEIEGDSAEDLADDMQRSGLPGWIIPNNYPDGDDILLVRLENVRQTVQEAQETGGAALREDTIPYDAPREPGLVSFHAVYLPHERLGRIDMIDVHPEMHGGGIGKRSVQAFEEWVKDQGGVGIIGSAFPTSVGFWQHMGYRTGKKTGLGGPQGSVVVPIRRNFR